MPERGSVFAEWHEDVRYPYALMLRRMIIKLDRLPRWSDHIFPEDIAELQSLCKAFDIKINHDEDLTDPTTFEMKKGEIKNKIKEILEKELKPEDPYIKLLEKINVDDVKKIIGGEKKENEEI